MRSEEEIKREIEIIKIAKDVNKNGYPDLLHAILFVTSYLARHKTIYYNKNYFNKNS